jgi:precorrin-6B methylase 2
VQKKVFFRIHNLRRKVSCRVFSAIEIIAVHNQFVYRCNTWWSNKWYIDEVHLANIQPYEKVLHIGCGSLPRTSLLVAEMTKTKVTAIDNNTNAVKRAQRYINQQKLTDFITVEYAEAAQYPVEEFDVIFLPINIVSIETVFRHLASNAKSSVRIICRDFGEGITNLLKNDEFTKSFTIKSIVKHLHIHSLLILKK